jgi:hypothetical protein
MSRFSFWKARPTKIYLSNRLCHSTLIWRAKHNIKIFFGLNILQKCPLLHFKVSKSPLFLFYLFRMSCLSRFLACCILSVAPYLLVFSVALSCLLHFLCRAFVLVAFSLSCLFVVALTPSKSSTNVCCSLQFIGGICSV